MPEATTPSLKLISKKKKERVMEWEYFNKE